MNNEKLKKARKEAKLTQKQMGEKLGLTLAGYRQKEVGERKISLPEAIEMAKILKVPFNDIFLEMDNHTDDKREDESTA